MEYLSSSLSGTESFAQKTYDSVKKHHSKTATVVGLFGELGSGKTTFVQFLTKTMGIKGPITSPTFVIEKIYQTNESSGFKNFIHIDAYRIQSTEEIVLLGWDNLVSRPENIIVVEWADRIESVLPKDTIRIYFSHVNETTRKIETKHVR